MSEAEFKLVAKLGKRIAELEAEVERLRTLLADEFVLDGLSPDDAVKAVGVLLKERDG